MAAALGVGPSVVGRAAGAYDVATAMSAFACGRLVERLPRRTALRTAMALLPVGLLLVAARGPVMALYSTVNYLAAAIAVVALGPVYEASGMAGVAAGAAGALLHAVAPAAALGRGDRLG